ncbi:MAG: hypothetical protein WD448_13625 [Woeseia sp.]
MTVLAVEMNGAYKRPARPWLMLVLLLVTAGALLWLVTHQSQRAWNGGDEVALTLAGEHYRVTPQQLAWLEGFSALHFSEGEVAARELIAGEVGGRLDRVFAGVQQRLPAFADWYYSLGGEYTRLAMMAMAWVNLADGDYVANRAADMLFRDSDWDSDLARMESETAARVQGHHEQVREDWLSELTRRLSAHRVPTPLTMPGAEPAARSGQIRLDALVGEVMAQERAALETRVSISTLAAGGAMVGPGLWRAASRRSATTTGRAISRGLGRGAARAGSAAAGGAAVCAPSGPVALGCALLAGAATWLAADWVLLRIDEHVNRDEMLRALEISLSALRGEMERDLLEAYDRMVADHYQAVQQDIHDSFVPAKKQPRAAH